MAVWQKNFDLESYNFGRHYCSECKQYYKDYLVSHKFVDATPPMCGKCGAVMTKYEESYNVFKPINQQTTTNNIDNHDIFSVTWTILVMIEYKNQDYFIECRFTNYADTRMSIPNSLMGNGYIKRENGYFTGKYCCRNSDIGNIEFRSIRNSMGELIKDPGFEFYVEFLLNEVHNRARNILKSDCKQIVKTK